MSINTWKNKYHPIKKSIRLWMKGIWIVTLATQLAFVAIMGWWVYGTRSSNPLDPSVGEKIKWGFKAPYDFAKYILNIDQVIKDEERVESWLKKLEKTIDKYKNSNFFGKLKIIINSGEIVDDKAVKYIDKKWQYFLDVKYNFQNESTETLEALLILFSLLFLIKITIIYPLIRQWRIGILNKISMKVSTIVPGMLDKEWRIRDIISITKDLKTEDLKDTIERLQREIKKREDRKSKK